MAAAAVLGGRGPRSAHRPPSLLGGAVTAGRPLKEIMNLTTKVDSMSFSPDSQVSGQSGAMSFSLDLQVSNQSEAMRSSPGLQAIWMGGWVEALGFW